VRRRHRRPPRNSSRLRRRTFTAEAKSIELLTLYEQRINRTLQRNLALLQQLQATRKAELKAVPKGADKPARPIKINDLPEGPMENGFVFSPAAVDPKLRPDQAENRPGQANAQAA
jgi:hypothetical protein